MKASDLFVKCLEEEGVEFNDRDAVDLKRYRWEGS